MTYEEIKTPIEDLVKKLELGRENINSKSTLADIREYIDVYLLLTQRDFYEKMKRHLETNYYEGCARMKLAEEITMSSRIQLLSDIDKMLKR